MRHILGVLTISLLSSVSFAGGKYTYYNCAAEPGNGVFIEDYSYIIKTSKKASANESLDEDSKTEVYLRHSSGSWIECEKRPGENAAQCGTFTYPYKIGDVKFVGVRFICDEVENPDQY